MSKSVFIASVNGLETGSAVDMKSAEFKERQNLQQWLLNNPDIIEPGFYVLTSEFDRWQTAQGDKQSDRLDILGIDSDGRLVVVELKRGACPDATDMQAIKYAALSSQFTVQTLIDAHAHYLEATSKKYSLEELHAILRKRSNAYDNIAAKVGVPRIILIAESFPSTVTSTAAFLSGLGLAIKLIQFQVTRFKSMPEAAFVIAFDTLFPPPGMESFISIPRSPTISQVVDQEVEDGEARQATTVAQIINSARIPSGATVVFRPPYNLNGIEAWLRDNPREAVWQQERLPLLWQGKAYSPTGLALQIISEASPGTQPKALQGPKWWTYEDKTLVELRDEVRLSESQLAGVRSANGDLNDVPQSQEQDRR